MKGQVEAARSIVFVVDDDASVREAIRGPLRSVGLQVEVFGTAAEFLKNKSPDVTACLILDIRKCSGTCTSVYTGIYSASGGRARFTPFFARRSRVDKCLQAIATRAQPSTPTRLH